MTAEIDDIINPVELIDIAKLIDELKNADLKDSDLDNVLRVSLEKIKPKLSSLYVKASNEAENYAILLTLKNMLVLGVEVDEAIALFNQLPSSYLGVNEESIDYRDLYSKVRDEVDIAKGLKKRAEIAEQEKESINEEKPVVKDITELEKESVGEEIPVVELKTQVTEQETSVVETGKDVLEIAEAQLESSLEEFVDVNGLKDDCSDCFLLIGQIRNLIREAKQLKEDDKKDEAIAKLEEANNLLDHEMNLIVQGVENSFIETAAGKYDEALKQLDNVDHELGDLFYSDYDLTRNLNNFRYMLFKKQNEETRKKEKLFSNFVAMPLALTLAPPLSWPYYSYKLGRYTLWPKLSWGNKIVNEKDRKNIDESELRDDIEEVITEASSEARRDQGKIANFILRLFLGSMYNDGYGYVKSYDIQRVLKQLYLRDDQIKNILTALENKYDWIIPITSGDKVAGFIDDKLIIPVTSKFPNLFTKSRKVLSGSQATSEKELSKLFNGRGSDESVVKVLTERKFVVQSIEEQKILMQNEVDGYKVTMTDGVVFYVTKDLFALRLMNVPGQNPIKYENDKAFFGYTNEGVMANIGEAILLHMHQDNSNFAKTLAKIRPYQLANLDGDNSNPMLVESRGYRDYIMAYHNYPNLREVLEDQEIARRLIYSVDNTWPIIHYLDSYLKALSTIKDKEKIKELLDWNIVSKLGKHSPDNNKFGPINELIKEYSDITKDEVLVLMKLYKQWGYKADKTILINAAPHGYIKPYTFVDLARMVMSSPAKKRILDYEGLDTNIFVYIAGLGNDEHVNKIIDNEFILEALSSMNAPIQSPNEGIDFEYTQSFGTGLVYEGWTERYLEGILMTKEIAEKLNPEVRLSFFELIAPNYALDNKFLMEKTINEIFSDMDADRLNSMFENIFDNRHPILNSKLSGILRVANGLKLDPEEVDVHDKSNIKEVVIDEKIREQLINSYNNLKIGESKLWLLNIINAHLMTSDVDKYLLNRDGDEFSKVIISLVEKGVDESRILMFLRYFNKPINEFNTASEFFFNSDIISTLLGLDIPKQNMQYVLDKIYLEKARLNYGRNEPAIIAKQLKNFEDVLKMDIGEEGVNNIIDGIQENGLDENSDFKPADIAKLLSMEGVTQEQRVRYLKSMSLYSMFKAYDRYQLDQLYMEDVARKIMESELSGEGVIKYLIYFLDNLDRSNFYSTDNKKAKGYPRKQLMEMPLSENLAKLLSNEEPLSFESDAVVQNDNIPKNIFELTLKEDMDERLYEIMKRDFKDYGLRRRLLKVYDSIILTDENEGISKEDSARDVLLSYLTNEKLLDVITNQGHGMIKSLIRTLSGKIISSGDQKQILTDYFEALEYLLTDEDFVGKLRKAGGYTTPVVFGVEDQREVNLLLKWFITDAEHAYENRDNLIDSMNKIEASGDYRNAMFGFNDENSDKNVNSLLRETSFDENIIDLFSDKDISLDYVITVFDHLGGFVDEYYDHKDFPMLQERIQLIMKNKKYHYYLLEIVDMFNKFDISYLLSSVLELKDDEFPFIDDYVTAREKDEKTNVDDNEVEFWYKYMDTIDYPSDSDTHLGYFSKIKKSSVAKAFAKLYHKYPDTRILTTAILHNIKNMVGDFTVKENIKIAKMLGKDVTLDFIKKDMNLAIVFSRASDLPIILQKALGINIKLATYIAQKPEIMTALRRTEIIDPANRVAYLLNKEVSLHPKEFRMSEDEKTSLFEHLLYMFTAKNLPALFGETDTADELSLKESIDHLVTQTQIFDEYFKNDASLYQIEIPKIMELLEFLTLDEVIKVIRMIKEDPKQSIDELKESIKNRISEVIEERKEKGLPALETEDPDLIIDRLSWILSNLFVLEAKISTLNDFAEQLKEKDELAVTRDLMDILDELNKAQSFSSIKEIADEHGFDLIGLFKFKLESIDALAKEKIVISAINELSNNNILGNQLGNDILDLFDSLPEESKTRIYMNILLSQNTDNNIVVGVMDEIRSNTPISKFGNKEFIVRLLNERGDVLRNNQLLLDYVDYALTKDKKQKKELLKPLKSIYKRDLPSTGKIKNDKFALEELEKIKTAINVERKESEKEKFQISHMYYEALLKLTRLDDLEEYRQYKTSVKYLGGAINKYDTDVLDQFRTLIRDINTNPRFVGSSADKKNKLYEELKLLSEIGDQSVTSFGQVKEYSIIKRRLFRSLMNHINNKYDISNPEVTEDAYNELMILLRKIRKLLEVSKGATMKIYPEELNAKLLRSSENIIIDIYNGYFDNEAFDQLFTDLSKVKVQGLVGIFKNKIDLTEYEFLVERYGTNDIDVINDKLVEELTLYSVNNPRFEWKDHQERDIFELIQLFLSNINENEIYSVILEGFLHEMDGDFAKWRYESNDYTAFMKAIEEGEVNGLILTLSNEAMTEIDRIISFNKAVEVEETDQGEQEVVVTLSRREALLKYLEQIKDYEEYKEYDEYEAYKEDYAKITEYLRLTEARLKAAELWKQNMEYEVVLGDETYRAVFTDDFYTLFNIGNYPGQIKCQSCTYGTSLNRGLTGYTMNGANKAVAILNEKGQVVTRRMVRLRFIKNDNVDEYEPAIFVEESTQFGSNGIEKLYAVLKILSKKTGLKVIASKYRESSYEEVEEGVDTKSSFKLFGGRTGWDYSDAYGAISTLDAGNDGSNAETIQWVTARLYYQIGDEVETKYINTKIKPEVVESREEIENGYGMELLEESVIEEIIEDETEAVEEIIGEPLIETEEEELLITETQGVEVKKIEERFDLKMGVYDSTDTIDDIVSAEQSSEIHMVRVDNPSNGQVNALKEQGYFYRPAKIAYNVDVPQMEAGETIDDALAKYYTNFKSKKRRQFKKDTSGIDVLLESGELELVEDNGESTFNDERQDFLDLYTAEMDAKAKGRKPLVTAIEKARGFRSFLSGSRTGMYLKRKSDGKVIGGIIVNRLRSKYSIGYASTDSDARRDVRNMQFYLMQHVLKKSIDEGLSQLSYGVDTNLYGHHLGTGLMQAKLSSQFVPTASGKNKELMKITNFDVFDKPAFFYSTDENGKLRSNLILTEEIIANKNIKGIISGFKGATDEMDIFVLKDGEVNPITEQEILAPSQGFVGNEGRARGITAGVLGAGTVAAIGLSSTTATASTLSSAGAAIATATSLSAGAIASIALGGVALAGVGIYAVQNKIRNGKWFGKAAVTEEIGPSIKQEETFTSKTTQKLIDESGEVIEPITETLDSKVESDNTDKDLLTQLKSVKELTLEAKKSYVNGNLEQANNFLKQAKIIVRDNFNEIRDNQVFRKAVAENNIKIVEELDALIFEAEDLDIVNDLEILLKTLKNEVNKVAESDFETEPVSKIRWMIAASVVASFIGLTYGIEQYQGEIVNFLNDYVKDVSIMLGPATIFGAGQYIYYDIVKKIIDYRYKKQYQALQTEKFKPIVLEQLKQNYAKESVESRISELKEDYTTERKKTNGREIVSLMSNALFEGENREVFLKRFREILAKKKVKIEQFNKLSKDLILKSGKIENEKDYLDLISNGRNLLLNDKHEKKIAEAFVEAFITSEIWPHKDKKTSLLEHLSLAGASQLGYLGENRVEDIKILYNNFPIYSAHFESRKLLTKPKIVFNRDIDHTLDSLFALFLHEFGHYVHAEYSKTGLNLLTTEGFAEDFQYHTSYYFANLFRKPGEKSDSGFDLIAENRYLDRQNYDDEYTNGRVIFKTIHDLVSEDVFKEEILPKLLNEEITIIDALHLAGEYAEAKQETKSTVVAEETKPSILEERPTIDLSTLLKDSELVKKVTELNDGKSPQVINVYGDQDSFNKELTEKLANIQTNDFIILQLHKRVDDKDEYVTIIDRAGHLRRNADSISELNIKLEGYEFSGRFLMDFENDVIELKRISIGRRYKEELASKGYVKEIAQNLADELRKKYAGYSIVSVAIHETSKQFMQGFFGGKAVTSKEYINTRFKNKNILLRFLGRLSHKIYPKGILYVGELKELVAEETPALTPSQPSLASRIGRSVAGLAGVGLVGSILLGAKSAAAATGAVAATAFSIPTAVPLLFVGAIVGASIYFKRIEKKDHNEFKDANFGRFDYFKKSIARNGFWNLMGDMAGKDKTIQLPNGIKRVISKKFKGTKAEDLESKTLLLELGRLAGFLAGPIGIIAWPMYTFYFYAQLKELEAQLKEDEEIFDNEIETEATRLLEVIKNNPPQDEITQKAVHSLEDLGEDAIDEMIEVMYITGFPKSSYFTLANSLLNSLDIMGKNKEEEQRITLALINVLKTPDLLNPNYSSAQEVLRYLRITAPLELYNLVKSAKQNNDIELQKRALRAARLLVDDDAIEEFGKLMLSNNKESLDLLEKLGTGYDYKFALQDLGLIMNHPEIIKSRLRSREELIESIQEDIPEVTFDNSEVRDYNTESFDESKYGLSTLTLLKIKLFLEALKDPDQKAKIGNMIVKNLRIIDTELGGLVFANDKGVKFKEYEPKCTGDVCTYQTSDKLSVDKIDGLSSFHLHALEIDGSHEFAGPSGTEGDLRTAAHSLSDGLVITHLGGEHGINTFNVDFYTPNGVVVDLGVYSWDLNKAPFLSAKEKEEITLTRKNAIYESKFKMETTMFTKNVKGLASRFNINLDTEVIKIIAEELARISLLTQEEFETEKMLAFKNILKSLDDKGLTDQSEKHSESIQKIVNEIIPDEEEIEISTFEEEPTNPDLEDPMIGEYLDQLMSDDISVGTWKSTVKTLISRYTMRPHDNGIYLEELMEKRGFDQKTIYEVMAEFPTEIWWDTRLGFIKYIESIDKGVFILNENRWNEQIVVKIEGEFTEGQLEQVEKAMKTIYRTEFDKQSFKEKLQQALKDIFVDNDVDCGFGSIDCGTTGTPVGTDGKNLEKRIETKIADTLMEQTQKIQFDVEATGEVILAMAEQDEVLENIEIQEWTARIFSITDEAELEQTLKDFVKFLVLKETDGKEGWLEKRYGISKSKMMHYFTEIIVEEKKVSEVIQGQELIDFRNAWNAITIIQRDIIQLAYETKELDEQTKSLYGIIRHDLRSLLSSNFLAIGLNIIEGALKNQNPGLYTELNFLPNRAIPKQYISIDDFGLMQAFEYNKRTDQYYAKAVAYIEEDENENPLVRLVFFNYMEKHKTMLATLLRGKNIDPNKMFGLQLQANNVGQITGIQHSSQITDDQTSQETPIARENLDLINLALKGGLTSLDYSPEFSGIDETGLNIIETAEEEKAIRDLQEAAEIAEESQLTPDSSITDQVNGEMEDNKQLEIFVGNDVVGTGPEGKITEEDFVAALVAANLIKTSVPDTTEPKLKELTFAELKRKIQEGLILTLNPDGTKILNVHIMIDFTSEERSIVEAAINNLIDTEESILERTLELLRLKIDDFKCHVGSCSGSSAIGTDSRLLESNFESGVLNMVKAALKPNTEPVQDLSSMFLDHQLELLKKNLPTVSTDLSTEDLEAKVLALEEKEHFLYKPRDESGNIDYSATYSYYMQGIRLYQTEEEVPVLVRLESHVKDFIEFCQGLGITCGAAASDAYKALRLRPSSSEEGSSDFDITVPSDVELSVLEEYKTYEDFEDLPYDTEDVLKADWYTSGFTARQIKFTYDLRKYYEKKDTDMFLDLVGSEGILRHGIASIPGATSRKIVLQSDGTIVGPEDYILDAVEGLLRLTKPPMEIRQPLRFVRFASEEEGVEISEATIIILKDFVEDLFVKGNVQVIHPRFRLTTRAKLVEENGEVMGEVAFQEALFNKAFFGDLTKNLAKLFENTIDGAKTLELMEKIGLKKHLEGLEIDLKGMAWLVDESKKWEYEIDPLDLRTIIDERLEVYGLPYIANDLGKLLGLAFEKEISNELMILIWGTEFDDDYNSANIEGKIELFDWSQAAAFELTTPLSELDTKDLRFQVERLFKKMKLTTPQGDILPEYEDMTIAEIYDASNIILEEI
ncbi:hypothetical protein HOL83_01405 [Candidatus Woesearchaeota archaeon]|nr:hypothetical protein [Candidatus Woesearchaeota archaeon]